MVHVTRSQLLDSGWTDGRIARAVSDGRLDRIRVGHFATGHLDPLLLRAISVGGRLACVSELRHRGVWVRDGQEVHVHLPRNAARLRADPDGHRLHWESLREPARLDGDHVGIIDALVEAWSCLERRDWIASVDGAIHLGFLGGPRSSALGAALPREARRALSLCDGRAESGLESIVRVIAHDLGFDVRSQVRVAGVGRVDLVIAGWIAVETDGTAFHDLPLAAADRRRDALLAARGMPVLRPGYSLIMYERRTVAEQLIGAVEVHRRVHDSGQLAARARRRLEKLDWS